MRYFIPAWRCVWTNERNEQIPDKLEEIPLEAMEVALGATAAFGRRESLPVH